MRNNFFRTFASFFVLVSIASTSMAQNRGFDPTRMDKSVDACNDFFEYANGTWVKNTTIPASQSRWGSFNILADNNREILKGVLEKAESEKAAKGTNMQLVGDFYSACMNEDMIEKAGYDPVKPVFRVIDGLKNKKDLARVLAEIHNMGIPGFFFFGGGPDLKNSKMTIANAGQAGLSMPNKDYYVGGDPKSAETREKFRDYMRTIFMLAGDGEQDARDHAFSVMRIQTELAYASFRSVELRNPDNRYNKVSMSEAAEITPDFSWGDYMRLRGVGEVDSFNIGQPRFFKGFQGVIGKYSVGEIKTYLRWMVLNASAPMLSSKFVDANFDFFGRHLQGTSEQLPRWQRCVRAVDGSLGEALGMEYVKVAFKPEAKERMDKLIDNLFVAMRQRIDSLEWMTDETKVQALTKLSTFNRKIGYPDKLRGYEGLDINRDSYLGNARRATQLQLKRNIADIGKPVDNTRWGMTPPTVNAYYSPILNEIVFPAGILQPPFFNPEADDAINYGAIGAVIGHEITHGFDDQGSQFDADGNFKNWWSTIDRDKFKERASCVSKQFSGYEVQKGLFMDGNLTLGENIADLGGLTVAYDAYLNSLKGKDRPEDIDGLTAEQRFFLGWAQVWAVKSTEAAERLQVSTDPHAVARWRVNGPMSNMPQFAKAFGCKQPEKMVRVDACMIW
ncbi:MAG: M13 family metallopeptidase [Pyrinomonadaceae bacterium]